MWRKRRSSWPAAIRVPLPASASTWTPECSSTETRQNRSHCDSACRRLAPILLADVAVHDLRAEAFFGQVLADGLGDHHRAVPPARAAEGDRQVALPFPHVVRDQIGQQLRDVLVELLRLRK